MTSQIDFNGSIPQHYEDYLRPFLFEAFAEDLARRMAVNGKSKVLELAAGTGCLTAHLVRRMPASTHFTITDLQAGMLDIARKRFPDGNISWDVVDMTNIPYENNEFDAVVCQFGIMLVADKLKALQEINRILRKGGQLLFNTWGNISDNQIWNIGVSVIGSYLPKNPIQQDPGPFSMNEVNTREWLQSSAFLEINAEKINLTGTIETAAMAAKGFIEGLPVVLAISKNNPELVPVIQHALEKALAGQLGDHPLKSRLSALVFQATK